MITCPSCQHENPDSATHCEACLASLLIVTTIPCPSCNTPVQSDASFCGHCGFDLHAAKLAPLATEVSTPSSENSEPSLVSPEPAVSLAEGEPSPLSISPDEMTEINAIPKPANTPVPSAAAKTQLQQINASLLHVQTNITLELPNNLQVIHVGKPNNMIPPDIDVSGFPDSDIVSRVHADIRFEGDAFYFEDTGSSNGTYVNNTPLAPGNRHRLRPGDRISLGKGDKVSFVFQM